MAYPIIYSRETGNQLRRLGGNTEKFIRKNVHKYLLHQPDLESNIRRRLRPNPIAEWELRMESWRVLYNVHVDEIAVVIIAIGKKRCERLLIDDGEVTL